MFRRFVEPAREEQIAPGRDGDDSARYPKHVMDVKRPAAFIEETHNGSREAHPQLTSSFERIDRKRKRNRIIN